MDHLSLGSTVYFASSSTVINTAAPKPQNSRTPSTPNQPDLSWQTNELQGVVLFLGLVFTPSKTTNTFGTFAGSLLPSSSTIRLCGVRVNWDVAKKLDRCCKSRGILIQLSLEEEDDELFGGGVDFTNALLDWRRSGEGVGGVGGAWGEGDSCLLLVPEDCMKLTLTERGNNNKEGGEVPSEIEVVEGGGGINRTWKARVGQSTK